MRAKKTSSRSGVWIERCSTSMRGIVELVEQLPQRGDTAVARNLQSQLLGVGAAFGSTCAAALQACGSAKCSWTWPPGIRRLSSCGRALSDDATVVEYRDLVGQLVGLLEILGGEEDRDAVGDQLADDLPHGAAAARVQPGGRARRGRSRVGLPTRVIARSRRRLIPPE